MLSLLARSSIVIKISTPEVSRFKRLSSYEAFPVLTSSRGEVDLLLLRIKFCEYGLGWNVAIEEIGALMKCLYYELIELYLTS